MSKHKQRTNEVSIFNLSSFCEFKEIKNKINKSFWRQCTLVSDLVYSIHHCILQIFFWNKYLTSKSSKTSLPLQILGNIFNLVENHAILWDIHGLQKWHFCKQLMHVSNVSQHTLWTESISGSSYTINKCCKCIPHFESISRKDVVKFRGWNTWQTFS